MNHIDERPIIVGIQHAASDRRAALWAADQAQRLGAVVRLVHALNVTAVSFAGGRTSPRTVPVPTEAAAAERLEVIRNLVRRRSPGVSVAVSLRPGHPVRTLVEQSRDASVVVLGAPGHNLLHDTISGATAALVAARAACPTAIIPTEGSPPVEGPVVVGIDGSPAGERAVGIAFAEADARRVGLVAIHGWSDYVSDRRYRRACRQVRDWRDVEDREREILTERLAGWQETYPRVVVRRVVARQQPTALLLTQAQHGQLLVVGGRGVAGVGGMLLGSLSQKLIYSATCPLIVARSEPPRAEGEAGRR